MKPNFALKLSNDGVELLHRATGGWSLVGAVNFENDDVAEACARLVAEAERLEPGGLRTKLVLPDSEVRYTAVVAPGPTDEARRFQIEDEIERLTPYRIDELAYDWSVEDDHAMVVIAARETLIEAETFADGYGFNPVAFVAQPEPGQFSGEPFFGETMVAPTLLPAGAHVQPDLEPIRVIARKAEAPKAARPAEAKPEPAKAEAPKVEAPKADTAKVEIPAPKAADAPKAPEPKPAEAKPAEPRPTPKVAIGSAAAMERRPSPRAIPDGIPGLGGVPAAAPEPEGVGARVGNLVRRMGTALRREQAQAAKAEAAAATAPQRPAAAGPARPVLREDGVIVDESVLDDVPPVPGFRVARPAPASTPVPPVVAPSKTDAPKAEAVKPVSAKAEAPKSDTAKPDAAKEGAEKAEPAKTDEPTPAFAHRGTVIPAAKPPVDGAKADAPKVPSAGPEIKEVPKDAAKTDEPAEPMSFSSRRKTGTEAKPAELKPAARPAAIRPAAAGPAGGSPAVPPRGVVLAAKTGDAPEAKGNPGGRIAVIPAQGKPVEGGAQRFLDRARSAVAGVGALKPARPAAADTPADPAAPVSAPAAAPVTALDAKLAKRPVPTDAIVPTSRPPATETEKVREAEALTIFGARGAQKGSAGMARRGLLAAGGALLLLTAVAVWAIYFNGSDETQVAVSEPAAMPVEAGSLAQIEAPQTLAQGDAGAAVPPALSGPASPEDVGVADADVMAGDETVGELATAAEAPAAEAAPEAPAADPEQLLESLVAQARDEALPTEALPAETATDPASPEPAPAEVAEAPAAEAPVATAEAPAAPAETAEAATLAATQNETAPADGAEGSDSPQLAGAANTTQRLSLPSPATAPETDEVAFETPAPPPPFGTEFTFDDRGLVEATPEGALTPSGVTVYARRPEVAPVARPESVAAQAPAPVAEPAPATEPVAAAIESAIAEAVTGVPAPAPEAPGEAPAATETPAATEAPVATVDPEAPRADPALAEFRPQPRPERVRALGEQLEAERAATGDQTNLAPESAPTTDTAALATTPEAQLAAAASTAGTVAPADAAATRAGEAPGVAELASLQTTAAPGGISLDGLRPQRRPSDLAGDEVGALPEAEAAAVAAPEIDLTGATAEAVAASPVPGARPGDIAERAQAILAAASASRPAPTAGETVEGASDPVIPTAASVAAQATEENAIRLRDVNLIGVFGSENSRRALVRLSNGRVVRVQVGDRLDGGQVAAIGESELRYVRNGRNEVLRIGG